MSRNYNNPFYGNKLLDKTESSALWSVLTPSIKSLMNYLLSEFDGYISSTRDFSIYTGLSGILLLGLRFKQLPALATELALEGFCQSVDGLILRNLRCRNKSKIDKNCSALTSDYIGPCLLGALLFHLPQNERKSEEKTKASCVGCFEKLLRCEVYATAASAVMPNEALYGRTGYLACLMSLQEAGYQLPVNTVKNIVEKIITEGQVLRREMEEDGSIERLLGGDRARWPPMMFQWHDKFYLGGAHGFAGILSILLKINKNLPEAIPRGALENFILPTTLWLSRLSFNDSSTGETNWPSSVGFSASCDRLVQWCHGAPGIVPILLEAHRLTNNLEYLSKAEMGGMAVWRRGLLTKGCSLCHGSAGNAYALLSLYQYTGKREYLEQAIVFAKWCADYFGHAERSADRPLSLFEGVSGCIWFLVDMLEPSTGKFPLINC